MSAEKILLGSIIDIKKGDYITKKEAKKGPYPVILGGQEPAYYIDKYNHTGQAIVISRSGASAGYVSCWNEPIFVTDGFLIEPKENINPVFLYYLLKHHQPHFQGLQGGAAIPHVNPRIINAVEVICPKTDVQLRIADILSAYDNLIENNQRQIKLLEEAAQRLYKEWFVDLRFPGHEHTAIVDGVPEGWRKADIEAICTLSKKTLKPENIQDNLPYIGLEHMPRKSFCLSDWGSSSDVSSNKYSYTEDDIIFGKIRPYFHKVGFALNNGVASTDTIVMKATNEMWGMLLMTVSSVNFVDFTYKTCKEGSKMPRADWNEMKQYTVLIPKEDLLKSFNNFIWKTTRKIKALALETHALTEARDRLLPKLMSGEMEV